MRNQEEVSMRFVTRLLIAALVAGTSLVAPAQAQDRYPTQSVKFVVPFAAGSATDTLARLLGSRMDAGLGQSVVVENLAGGSGVIAAQAVARAAADGHTVLISTNTTHAANQSLLKKIPYDPIADFEPVSKLGAIPLALVAHPSVPADDVKQLISYAKANPGKLTFGSGSSSSRIAGEMLKAMAGIDLLHVPYKSNPQVVTDLLGGQIALFFGDISTSLPPVRAGKLKGFAVSSAQRSPLAPELPSLSEAGVPGYELTAWFGAWVPARTPAPVVTKLNAAFREALADKEIAGKLLTAGIEVEASSPDQLKAFVISETKKWAKIVADAGIQPE
jgi:tripartite-type tricarboxylate transporter receptor subunit TctC